MKEYRKEVNVILSADKQLASEIQFDLKRFEREQENVQAVPVLSVAGEGGNISSESNLLIARSFDNHRLWLLVMENNKQHPTFVRRPCVPAQAVFSHFIIISSYMKWFRHPCSAFVEKGRMFHCSRHYFKLAVFSLTLAI